MKKDIALKTRKTEIEIEMHSKEKNMY